MRINRHYLGPFLRGTLCLILAIFLFDVMGAIVKFLSAAYPAQQLSLFRNLFGLAPSLLVLFLARDWHAAGRPLKIRQWRLGLVRGGFVAVAQFCFYTALGNMAFATATTLAFAGPLLITALSVPILRHRVGIWRWSAVALGFVGVVMVMQPGRDAFGGYAILPVIAAFGYALTSVTVNLFDKSVPSALVNLYGTGGALIGACVVVLSSGAYVTVASADDWFWLILMGLVGGCAVLALVTAYRMTAPSSLAPFEYVGIPISFAIGWVIFNEAPFERLWPGALLIVAGGLLIVWRQHHNARHKVDP